MRFRLIALLLITVIPAIYGQSQPGTNGFTNKAEASNKMVNGLKDGKWVEYYDQSFNLTNDSTAPYYVLTCYYASQPVGMERSYYKSGAIYQEIPCSNGHPNGIEKTYYENGTLKRVKTYKDGLENGVEKLYYTTGKLKREITYVNDSAISEKDYDLKGNELNYSTGFK